MKVPVGDNEVGLSFLNALQQCPNATESIPGKRPPPRARFVDRSEKRANATRDIGSVSLIEVGDQQDTVEPRAIIGIDGFVRRLENRFELIELCHLIYSPRLADSGQGWNDQSCPVPEVRGIPE